jgi:hypothetical protein
LTLSSDRPGSEVALAEWWRIWDFFATTLSPATCSPSLTTRASAFNYRHMPGFGVHTFKLLNHAGKETYRRSPDPQAGYAHHSNSFFDNVARSAETEPKNPYPRNIDCTDKIRTEDQTAAQNLHREASKDYCCACTLRHHTSAIQDGYQPEMHTFL